VQDTPNGRLTFPFTIRNQFTTSRSSLEGLLAMRPKFLAYKRQFYRDSIEEVRKSDVKGFLVAAPGDPLRLRRFLDLLHRHDIRAYSLKADLTVGPVTYRSGEAYLIPTAQPEARFLHALFETRTEFADRVFYDISTWTLPLAFHLQFDSLTRLPEQGLGEEFRPGPFAEQTVPFSKDDVAYLLDWRHGLTPRVLHKLLAAGLKVRVAMAPFTAVIGKEVRQFGYGTCMIPLALQPDKRDLIVELLQAAAKGGVPVHALTTGLTLEGIKLGSSAFVPVSLPRVLLVTGEGVTAYEAGEVWHLLDERLAMPVTMVDTHRLGSVDLGRYTTVILVSGTYSGVSALATDRLKQYAERGGTLIAIGSSIPWLSTRKIVSASLREAEKPQKERRPYASMAEDEAEKLIAGAIFRTKTDPTHPVCYGLSADPLPVFRNNRVMLEPTNSPYNSPVVYTEKPLWSGHVSKENVERLAGSASVVVVPVGSGRAILFADNPNFRGFWHGTSRLFVNAIFFGPITRTSPARMR
jgi:hypothetical protein